MEEADERRRGKEAAALSGGHLCHVCGYQYPNPHPSAKLRRSHRKHCGKAAAAAAEAVAEVEEAVAAAGGWEERAGEPRNAAEAAAARLAVGGGGDGEGLGSSEADGGAALRGSAREVFDSAEGKETADASPTGSGARVGATESNDLNSYGNRENASPEETGDQVFTRELIENGNVDFTNNSVDILNEGNANESLACTDGSQSKLGHAVEREDSLDEYQDASPFLHQSGCEDGAAPSSIFSTETNNSNTVSSVSSVAANETSQETNELCKDQFTGEPNVIDVSTDSKVGYNLDTGPLTLAEPKVHLMLGGQNECPENVDGSYTEMVGNKADKTSGHGELVGDSNALSFQETNLFVLEPELGPACSGKVVGGFVEDRMHVLGNISEVLPRSEVVGSDRQLETVTDPNTNAVPIRTDLKAVCTDNSPADCSTELPMQNCTIEGIPHVQLPVGNTWQESLECATGAFQYGQPVATANDHPVTSVDGNSIAEESCSDQDFTFEKRPQLHILEENPSVEKTNKFTQEEVCDKQTDPEILTEDEFSMSQKNAAVLMDQSSSVGNPFSLDDARNDDLFELPASSCYLKAPNAVEMRQQVDTTSLIMDQPTVSNQTSPGEAQECHNSNEHIVSASSASEHCDAVAPQDIPVSCSADTLKTCLTDAAVNNGLQEDERHTSGVLFVPSQVASTEFTTIQDLSALRADLQENVQDEDASAKEVIAVHGPDNTEMKQALQTAAKDINAANVDEKKLTEDNAAEMNELGDLDYAEEKKQTGSTKEVSSVPIMGDLEENKQTEDISVKAMNVPLESDEAGEKTETDNTGVAKTNAVGGTDESEEKMLAQETTARATIAAQTTATFEEKKQPNDMVGQEGNNYKQKEEIAITGARLNSGRVHVPLKVLLAEASAENKVKKPSTKERVLSFRRRVSKDGNSSGSPKSGSDDHYWTSPAKLPRMDVDKKPRGKKQPWMPFICCHSVR